MNDAISGYALHLVFAWARNGLLQVPGICDGLEATSGEKLFLSLHFIYEDKFIEK